MIPIAVVGAEESMPSMSQARPLADLIGAPYVPIPFTLPLQRGDTLTTDILGAATWPLDLSLKTAGTSESYQVWFRDPQDPTGFGVGLSDGLTVTYCP